jgi:GNAT superfamily N-acetyltransferase
MDESLLAQIEDASLNASAPPQQRWIDGWLVRYSPGKARRARSVNAVAPGRLPLSEKLRLAAEVFAEAGLPMHVRVTPFSQPHVLDDELAARGWARIEQTWVMVRPDLATLTPPPMPSGTRWEALDADAYAETVGALRGSTPAERRAHAERLRLSPTPYRGYAAVDQASGAAVACGQFAREGRWVGLYDVFTAPERRGEGLATLICERLLSISMSEGARTAYLQVGADNHPARRMYHRLGFADGYSYHYRIPGDAT